MNKKRNCNRSEQIRRKLKKKYIGLINEFENTRLIYTVMHYSEENDIFGVLLIIYFKKAFDIVSLKFIHTC